MNVNSEKQTGTSCFHTCSRSSLLCWFSITIVNIWKQNKLKTKQKLKTSAEWPSIYLFYFGLLIFNSLFPSLSVCISLSLFLYTHRHIHTHTYIYKCARACVCVCMSVKLPRSTFTGNSLLTKTAISICIGAIALYKVEFSFLLSIARCSFFLSVDLRLNRTSFLWPLLFSFDRASDCPGANERRLLIRSKLRLGSI